MRDESSACTVDIQQSPAVRRLAPGDESILDFLARHDGDFDLNGRGKPLRPLDKESARRFLANDDLLFWIAFAKGEILGFLFCMRLPLRADSGHEVLLYEIGVHHRRRRENIGRRLIRTMDSWMHENGIRDVWVLADNPGAMQFYRTCGFSPGVMQPVYLVKENRTSK